MTGSTTRHSTTRLWKGTITMLLVVGTASSQRSTISNEAAPSVHSEPITDNPSGSVAPLRKVQSIVDSPSTTLKDVDDVRLFNVEDRIDDKSSAGLPIESISSQNDHNLSDGKSESLKVKGTLAKDPRKDEKSATNGDSPEFGENDDNGEIDDLLEEDDREPTTKTSKINPDENNATPTITKHKTKDPADDDPKAKGRKIGISLVNDTNVNYPDKKFVKDVNDASEIGEDANGSKSILENATNVIASGSDVADEVEEVNGPKAQVEVVRNSTLPKILRIIEVVDDEKRKEVKNLGPVVNVSVVTTTDSTVIHESNDLGTFKEKPGNSTIVDVGVVLNENNNSTNVSHNPKGRTIALGGVNEFVTDDNKTEEPIENHGGITERPTNKITTQVTEQPIENSKPNDFKPYPYAKTNHLTNSSEGDSTGNGRVAESTEETSALENTIGQRQQDKKFVVTEPSLVIDNSIQQFKSTDYKKSGNSSRITTSLDSTMPTTVSSFVGREKNESTSSIESIALKNDTTTFVAGSPGFNTENDVPRGKDKAGESTVNAKDNGRNIDLTGNGITEVIAGIKNDSVQAIEDSSVTIPHPATTSDILKSRATENPLVQISNMENNATIGNKIALTNVDVQTDPEESMLKVSSLNVTEGSSRIDFNRGPSNLTESTSTTLTPTLIPKVPFGSNSDAETLTMSTSKSPKILLTSTLMPESSLLSTNIPEDSPVSTLTTETSTMSNATPKMASTSKLNPLISSGTTASPSTSSTPSNATSANQSSAELKVPTVTVLPEQFTDDSAPKNFETSASFDSDDLLDSTTSNIEYVFVGLSESTLQPFATTLESPHAVSFDRERTSSTSSTANQSPTLSTTSTVESTTITSSVNENISTVKTNASEQISTDSVTTIVKIDNSQDFTTDASTREFTTLEYSTISMNEDATESTTTIDDTETTQPNVSVEGTTESLTALTNSTDVLGIVPDTIKNTTNTGRAVDSSTSVPDVTATTVGNSNATIIGYTETTNLSITTEIPNVSKVSNISESSTPNNSTANSTLENSRENITSERPKADSGAEMTSTRSTILTPKLYTSTTTEKNLEIVTDESIEISNRGGVPSLVKVVFEGSWADVCPHLDVLRQSLADLLTSGLEKTILASQIIFQQNACSAGFSTSTMTTILPITTLLLYVVDENGNFDSEMTKTLPTLYSKSPIKLQVNIRSFQLVQDSDSGNAIAVVVVSCVALICLVLLAGLLFIMRKRQTRFNYGERCRPVSLDAYSLDSVSAYNSVRRKGAARASKISYGNPTFEDSSAIPSHPLNFAGLSTFCNEQNAIAEEFAGIPQVTARIDELPPGAEVKNRYANVVPLPETRVSLMKINNDPLTEYINASYVRGSKSATKYYIACQAPIDSTVTDFWRMIWEQQTKVIIMLTDLVENGVEKCAEYLPPSEVTDCHRLFGDFQITLKKRETKEKYAISTINLKNLENNTFREISHIWYLWPANGVQSDAAGLIAVLLEARALQRGGPGPIVVHCSPGTGRTGTLIALDLGIRQYEITRTVDVPRVVYTIRRDRAGAVQTKEQYAFIYKALNLYATKLAGGALES